MKDMGRKQNPRRKKEKREKIYQEKLLKEEQRIKEYREKKRQERLDQVLIDIEDLVKMLGWYHHTIIDGVEFKKDKELYDKMVKQFGFLFPKI